MAPGQEGQAQGQHRSPERRREGSVQPPASPGLGPDGGQQPENGRGLVNGWPGGCKSDSPHVSKKRRKGGEGEACLPQDPPGHRSCSPSGAEPDATAASPRKKKKKRRKLGSQREGEDREHPEGWGGPALSASNPTPAVGSQGPGGPAGPEPAPRHSGTRESGASVVWELLGCAADGAYGRKVLTWGGEVSAVSLDAMQDRRVARASTVIDDWDEEFDRGKEKKIKKLKRERKRNFNAFQKLQNRRNFWSVTHPAKAASLSYRR